MEYTSCQNKQNALVELFANCSNDQEKYEKIMELGKKQQHLAETDKVPINVVKGCQSVTYLISQYDGNGVSFKGESDAFISAGLLALLLLAYDGESPEAILKCPPEFIDKLGLKTSLSPNRASGLYSIHLRMKQEALKYLV